MEAISAGKTFTTVFGITKKSAVKNIVILNKGKIFFII